MSFLLNYVLSTLGTTHDDLGRIIKYDNGRALFSRAWGFFLLSGHGNGLLGYIGLLVTTSVLLGLAKCDPTQKWSTGFGSRCVDVSYVWSDVTLLTLSSFLTAFLLNTTVSRWWQTRVFLADAAGVALQAFLQVRAAVDDHHKTPEVVTVLARIKRHLLLAYQIMLRNVTRHHNKSLEDLVTEGILTPEENAAFKGRNMVVIVIAWTLNGVTLLADMGVLRSPEATVINSMQMLGRYRTCLGDAVSMVITQLPYLSVSLVACVVHLCMFQIVYVSGSYIGTGMLNKSAGPAFSGFFTVLFVPLIFFSLLKIQDDLANPFGDDAVDFPVDAMYTAFSNQLNAVDEVGDPLTSPEEKRQISARVSTRVLATKLETNVALDATHAMPSMSWGGEIRVVPE